jgi:hypothetical protein
VTDVQAMVENHLKDMILKTFDPKKADTIFTEEGEVSLMHITSIHRYIIIIIIIRRRRFFFYFTNATEIN